MILFCITSYNNIMYELVIEKSNLDTVVILTDRADVFAWGETTSAHAIYNMQIPSLMDKVDEDELFANVALPGLFSGMTFDGTELPLDAVLSLDRLKFWFDANADRKVEYIDAFSPSEVYISSDLGSSLPWSAYLMAKAKDVPVTLVQTEDIRTLAFVDFIKLIDLESIIVTPDNVEFVRGICKANVIIKGQQKDGAREAESLRKAELRKGFGIRSDEKVVGILFDKRDEWQCRRWLSENLGAHATVFVYPIDARSSALVGDVLRGYLPAITITNDANVLHVCNDIVSFRYYHRRFTEFNVIYSDYGGINKVEGLK